MFGSLLHLYSLGYREHRRDWETDCMSEFPVFEKSPAPSPVPLLCGGLSLGKTAEREKSSLIVCFSEELVWNSKSMAPPQNYCIRMCVLTGRFCTHIQVWEPLFEFTTAAPGLLYVFIPRACIRICDPGIESNVIIFTCERVDTVIIYFVYKRNWRKSLFLYWCWVTKIILVF